MIAIWNKRREPLRAGRREGLPPLDTDLRALAMAVVPEGETLPLRASPHARKQFEVRRDLVGKSELAALNALLIAHLRKQSYPDHAPQLFRRIWTEEADHLLQELSSRWLISSAITFGDHGETEAQRRIGLAMNVLFSQMKLYEFERVHSGVPADQPFRPRPGVKQILPMDLPGFALLSGGLDINLLAQIWSMALEEPIAGRLACHLLDKLNDDPRSLFRRISLMRADLIARRAAKAAGQTG